MEVTVGYTVECECGRRLEVAAGAAGSRLGCACGREVAVPSLRELRLRAGPGPEPDVEVPPDDAPGFSFLGLTLVSWVLIALLVAALVAVNVVMEATFPEAADRRVFRVVFGGGVVMGFALVAALLRVFGVRFVRGGSRTWDKTPREPPP
jgi:hypothetical protein